MLVNVPDDDESLKNIVKVKNINFLKNLMFSSLVLIHFYDAGKITCSQSSEFAYSLLNTFKSFKSIFFVQLNLERCDFIEIISICT